jgi:RloB-like protein
MVFTEGKNSEPDYVNGLKRLPHIAEDVALNLQLFPEHGVPLTLVQHAIRQGKDPEIDECWCLFDVEWPKNHPNLMDAVSRARSRGVMLAMSNPCFEQWLVLHHQDQTKFLTTKDVEHLSRELDGRAGKSIDPATYMPLRKIASKRAEALAERHEHNGTRFPDDNPSSGMYLFLRSLEG